MQQAGAVHLKVLLWRLQRMMAYVHKCMFDFDTQPKIRVTNVTNRWLQLLDNR
jgi:hypothetical protein